MRFHEKTNLILLWCFLKIIKFSATLKPDLNNNNLSPCPDIFQYMTDNNGHIYGLIEIQPPLQNIIKLNVQLSVGNRVGDYHGSLEMAYSKTRILDNIVNQKTIHYNVYFPYWSIHLPRLTKIFLNDQLICTGSGFTGLISLITTIDLQNIFTITTATTLNNQPVTQITEKYVPNDLLPIQTHHNINIFVLRNLTNPIAELTPLIDPRASHQSILSEICGLPVVVNHLIINGNSVIRGAYPWLVAIFLVKNIGLEYQCSGSLISHHHIVTAAHCVFNRKSEDILLVLGKLNIKKWTNNDDYEKMIEPSLIKIHPNYKTNSSDADIAVIIIKDKLQFSNFIRPICLWNGTNDLNKIVGQLGTVIGWGRNENGQIMTSEPKQINLPIVSQEKCLRSYPSFQYITSENTFCAGFRNGSGPCNGDSGSGFIMKQKNLWYLRGVVSMGIPESTYRTCDLSYYVVFTDISKYLDWLNNILN